MLIFHDLFPGWEWWVLPVIRRIPQSIPAGTLIMARKSLVAAFATFTAATHELAFIDIHTRCTADYTGLETPSSLVKGPPIKVRNRYCIIPPTAHIIRNAETECRCVLLVGIFQHIEVAPIPMTSTTVVMIKGFVYDFYNTGILGLYRWCSPEK